MEANSILGEHGKDGGRLPQSLGIYGLAISFANVHCACVVKEMEAFTLHICDVDRTGAS